MMRPFFRHPGSKYLLTKRLPRPRYDMIIEPFAGSACYSVTHGAGRPVLLCDADPSIVAIWRWLISADPSEVLRIPVDFGDADIRTIGVEGPALLLLQRWLNPQGGGTNWRMPPACIKHAERWPTSWWGAHLRGLLADQLAAIRRWSIVECDYREIEHSTPSTWVIDPPYQANDHARAKYGADVLDYAALADWCLNRSGQVIVHEQHGATWLPFETLNAAARTGKTAGGTMKSAHEVVWVNDAPLRDPLFAWAGVDRYCEASP